MKEEVDWDTPADIKHLSCYLNNMNNDTNFDVAICLKDYDYCSQPDDTPPHEYELIAIDKLRKEAKDVISKYYGSSEGNEPLITAVFEKFNSYIGLKISDSNLESELKSAESIAMNPNVYDLAAPEPIETIQSETKNIAL